MITQGPAIDIIREQVRIHLPKLEAIGNLSEREEEILLLVGGGMSCEAIAKKLFRSRKTIESVREHIKQKMKLSNVYELHQYAALYHFLRSCEKRIDGKRQHDRINESFLTAAAGHV